MNREDTAMLDRKEELVKKGLERSCESLSFFLKEKVGLETLRFSDERVSLSSVLEEFRGKDIILYSEILGQIQGQCYFLLEQKEADLLFQKNFTATNNEMTRKPIYEGFLLELDNIITASVVTEFANNLQLKIFGGVPSIIYNEEKDRLDETLKKTDKEPYFINFKCRYSIQGAEFSPMFFWFLEPKFTDWVSLRTNKSGQ